MMFTIKPTKTVNAEFSKSVSCISSGRNSTLQPISESVDGGLLNLNEFQLVDWRFSKWLTSFDGGTLDHHPPHVETPSLFSS